MRRLLGILAVASTVLAAQGAEPARKELVVETDWKLSGAKIDQSEKPGEGVTTMTVTGQPTLTKEKKEGSETISVTGRADTIVYHVILKKFVLRGSPSLTEVNTKGHGRIIEAAKPGTTIEIRAHNGEVRTEGPNKVRLIDVDASAKPKRK